MDLFETLPNPYLFTALIVLTMLSTFFTLMGIKEKNIPNFIIGVGAGIPTFALANWKMWVCGAAIVGTGMYLRSKLNSPV